MPECLYEKNQMGVGFTFNRPAVYQDQWLKSWKGDKPLLDIGAGHGTNTRAALIQGCQVVATDLEQPDLTPWLADLPAPQQASATYAAARLPDHMPFADNSFCGILCSEVFHFLSNKDVIPAIAELFRILEPNGTLILTCGSYNVKALSGTGLKQQIHEHANQSPLTFKGSFNLLQIMTQAAKQFNAPEKTTPILKEIENNNPNNNFQLFMAEQLKHAMEQKGFIIEICEQGDAPHYPLWVHGDQDQVRIIAQKPEPSI